MSQFLYVYVLKKHTGQKPLRRLYDRFASARGGTQQWGCPFHSNASPLGIGILRGLPQPAGCNHAREISQDRVGKALLEKSSASLSHGVNWLTNNGVASQFRVNWLNELTNSGGYTNFFDANGNMTNSYGWEFMTYDDENRLTVILDIRLLGFRPHPN
jgi:hypothetical protein